MFHLDSYSSKIQSILRPHEAGRRLMPLAPSSPLQGEGLDLLENTRVDELFDGAPITAPDFAECVRSALFLYFSDLDRSHKISQRVHSTTGSYWHGIMHRQEPDFSNSKYWFRKVSHHEVFPAIRAAALEQWSAAAGEKGAMRLLVAIQSSPQWDPFWFIDQCEAVRLGDASELEAPLKAAQRIEWQILFDYCYQKAVAPN